MCWLGWNLELMYDQGEQVKVPHRKKESYQNLWAIHRSCSLARALSANITWLWSPLSMYGGVWCIQHGLCPLTRVVRVRTPFSHFLMTFKTLNGTWVEWYALGVEVYEWCLKEMRKNIREFIYHIHKHMETLEGSSNVHTHDSIWVIQCGHQSITLDTRICKWLGLLTIRICNYWIIMICSCLLT